MQFCGNTSSLIFSEITKQLIFLEPQINFLYCTSSIGNTTLIISFQTIETEYVRSLFEFYIAFKNDDFKTILIFISI